MRGICLILAAAYACRGESCIPVAGQRILAHDLAAASAEFAAVPADTPLAFAPAPGSPRVYRAAELHRLASRFHLTLVRERDVCFEAPLETLTAERIAEAMRAAPGMHDARIEMVDFSRQPAPRGKMEFPLQGLGAFSESGDGIVWRGFIRYGAGGRFAVWARARISVKQLRVVAVENIKARTPIEPGQVKVEEFDGFPARMAPAPAVAGSLALRSIRAGSTITAAMIALPDDVSRGETVRIEAHSGAARLALSGRAESGGRLGDRVTVRNLQSGKTFSARVAGKGLVVVTAREAM